MKQTTLAQLSKIEDLLRDRQYDRVLDALSSIDRSTLSRHECGWWCLLVSEAKLFKGRCGEVESYIRKAIERFRHDPDTEKYALSKFLLGWMYASSGDFTSAIEAYIDANSHYDRCGNQLACARTLNKLAYPQFQMGQMDAAIQNVKRSIAILQDDGRRVHTYMINLAMLQFRAGYLIEATKCYKDLVLNADGQGDRNMLVLFEMAAVAFTQCGDIKQARKMLARCEPFLSFHDREDGIYYENVGLVGIASREWAAAENALKIGLEIAFEIAPESSLTSQIKRLFGDLYIATEQWAKAERFTNEALAVAEKIGERVEIAACYRIFAQLAHHRSRDNKAREWFTKAVELFQLIGSNYELAVTRYLSGVSGLYQNGERHALLWMARQYFDSEKVKPYLKKIDKALSVSPPSESTKKSNSVASVSPVVIGKSKVMTDILTMAENVAPSNMTVFLTGATGTGKDLLAQYIHHHSGCEGEFVSVNAAAIPGPMIESELFGHTRGAFTGSDGDRVGLLEQANDGTFYLNEIADATMEFQAKLLEVLETRKIRRLGENKTRPVSFRLIAATNHDLKQRISEGKFRLDLYHRLCEIPIELPPLSKRTEDIPALVEYFLTISSNGHLMGGNTKILERLGFLLSVPDYDGNIRELKNRVKKLTRVSHGDPERMIETLVGDSSLSEREWLTRILHRTSWNRREAARLLGVSEGTIRYRIQRLSLTPVS